MIIISISSSNLISLLASWIFFVVVVTVEFLVLTRNPFVYNYATKAGTVTIGRMILTTMTFCSWKAGCSKLGITPVWWGGPQ